MSVVADYPDGAPHYATGQQISQTGVPLLNKSALIASKVGLTVPANGTIFTGIVGIAQPGYEVIVELGAIGTPTVPFGRADMFWDDQGSTVQVALDSWHIPAPGSGGMWTMNGHGPTKANQVDLVLVNLDPAVQMTGTMYVFQHSRPYTDDQWWYDNASNSALSVQGFTTPGLPIDNTVMGVVSSATIAAGASATWLMGMGNGKPVTLAGNTTGITPASIQLTALAQPLTLYGGGAVILRTVLSTAGYSFTILPPRGPWSLQVNNLATAGTLTFSGMAVAQNL